MYLKHRLAHFPQVEPFNLEPFNFKGFYNLEDIYPAAREFSIMRSVYASQELKKELMKENVKADQKLYKAYELAVRVNDLSLRINFLNELENLHKALENNSDQSKFADAALKLTQLYSYGATLPQENNNDKTEGNEIKKIASLSQIKKTNDFVDEFLENERSNDPGFAQFFDEVLKKVVKKDPVLLKDDIGMHFFERDSVTPYLKDHLDHCPDVKPFSFKGVYTLEDIYPAKKIYEKMKYVYAVKELKKELTKKIKSPEGITSTLYILDRPKYENYKSVITVLENTLELMRRLDLLKLELQSLNKEAFETAKQELIQSYNTEI